MARERIEVHFKPGNEVKVTLAMSRDTMEDIKNWLNDYSSMSGEPLTDVEAIQALFVVGDQFAEHRNWRDNVTVEKISNGYDVCIDKE